MCFCPTIVGVVLILLSQVFLTLDGTAKWGTDTKERMIDLEGENLQRLARGESGTVEEHFGRVRESALQLRSFAGQAIITEPETMVRAPFFFGVWCCVCSLARAASGSCRVRLKLLVL